MQGVDPKNVGNLKDLKLAKCVIGFYPERAVLGKKAGRYAAVLEFGIIKIAKYRRLSRFLHCKIVMRALPILAFFYMAVVTRPITHILRTDILRFSAGFGAHAAEDQQTQKRVTCFHNQNDSGQDNSRLQWPQYIDLQG